MNHNILGDCYSFSEIVSLYNCFHLCKSVIYIIYIPSI